MLKVSKILLAATFTAINGKEYRIDLLGAGYKCDAMKEYGYRTQKQCENAINRKLRKQSEKTANAGEYLIPLKDAIKEHTRLVEVLKSPSHEDDLVEAKDQEQELNDMLKK